MFDDKEEQSWFFLLFFQSLCFFAIIDFKSDFLQFLNRTMSEVISFDLSLPIKP